MRRTRLAVLAGLLAACGPQSHYHDYSTPERAARSFVEAGRVGDDHSLRRSVVAAERDGDLSCDYSAVGDYSLSLERLIDGQRAVVMLQTGPVSSPLACVKEDGEWKVSLRATLRCMQEMVAGRPASPR